MAYPAVLNASDRATDVLDLGDHFRRIGHDVSAGHVFGECAVRSQNVGAKPARSARRLCSRRSRDGADPASDRTLPDPENTRREPPRPGQVLSICPELGIFSLDRPPPLTHGVLARIPAFALFDDQSTMNSFTPVLVKDRWAASPKSETW